MAAFSVMLLQFQQVAENLILEKEEFLCACHSDKQSLGFLSKDPQIISLISKSTALHVHLFFYYYYYYEHFFARSLHGHAT